MFAFSHLTVFEYPPGSPGRTVNQASTTPYLTSIPTEVRFEILKLLLPDIARIPCRFNASDVRPQDITTETTDDSDEDDIAILPPPPTMYGAAPASTRGVYRSLRQDGQSCHPAIMQTCRQVYNECMSIIYAPTRTFEATIMYCGGAKMYLLHKLPWILQPRKQNKGTTKKFMALIKLLGQIKSLHITLPPYERQIWYQPLRHSIETFTHAMRDHFPDRCPFAKLTVDIMSDQSAYVTNPPLLPDGPYRRQQLNRQYPPPPPPPPFEIGITMPPSMIMPLYGSVPMGSPPPAGQIAVDQAYLKWTIAAFHDLFGLEDGGVQFLISGRSITEVNDPPLPILSEFVTRLTMNMCRDKADCAPWKLPTDLQRLTLLMVCNAPLRHVKTTMSLEVPVLRTSLPPPPPPMPPAPTPPDNRYVSPELWLWDCWDRGAWEEIQKEYDQMKDQWKELWQIAHTSFEGLDVAINSRKVPAQTVTDGE